MKNKMKKILSFFMAAVMLFSVCVPAFAASANSASQITVNVEVDKASYKNRERIVFNTYVENNSDEPKDVAVKILHTSFIHTNARELKFKDVAPHDKAVTPFFATAYRTKLHEESYDRMFKLFGGDLSVLACRFIAFLAPNMECMVFEIEDSVGAVVYSYEDITEKPVFEEKSDIDKDKVSDEVEDLFGTDKDKEDTDADGLSDYDELSKTMTIPTKADTDADGIKDGDEDLDGDGLTNLKEIELGSNPLEVDGDYDDLKDNEELKYHTNPAKADTDGDGIDDGTEIKLGLDPLKASTDGKTPDGERTFKQEVEAVDEELKEDNPIVPSISGNVPDDINKHVKVKQSTRYSVTENRAVVGKPVIVKTDYPEKTDMTITFSTNEGDPRLPFYVICKYDDNKIVPVKTTRGSNFVSAKVGAGEYFVVDSEKLLIDLDIQIDDYKDTKPEVKSTKSVRTMPNTYSQNNALSDEWYEKNYTTVKTDDVLNSKNSTKHQERKVLTSSLDWNKSRATYQMAKNSGISGQADIVFVIDSTGSMGDEINNVANNIQAFVDELSSRSVKVNFALVDYKDITCGEPTKIVKDSDGSVWFRDVNAYKQKISEIYVNGGGDGPETVVDALGAAALDTHFRPNVNKFVIVITDADYKVNNNYGISSMEEMVSKLEKNGICTSVISHNRYESIYHDLYTRTNGIFADITGNFKDLLLKLADRIGQEVNDGSWVVLSDLQIVKLEKELEKDDTDTDKDGIADWKELGSYTEMDVNEFIDTCLYAYSVPEDAFKGRTTIKVYDYRSNPVMEDTDYDGIKDGKEKIGCARNNSFRGKINNKTRSFDNAEYSIDFTKFVTEYGKFDNEINIASLIAADQMYNDGGFTYYEGSPIKKADNIRDFMNLHGFENIEVYKLEASEYHDNHLSEVAIGHHSFKFCDMTFTVVGIFVRGTNGTIEEWSSNFEVGKSGESWGIYHKGFKIAADRLWEKIDAYRVKYLVEPATKGPVMYWLTGHSRGAAIADILAAKLTNLGEVVFAYTFAAPASANGYFPAEQYPGIFNTAHSGDIVPRVPLSTWGFHHFGLLMEKYPENIAMKIWKEGTGKEFIAPSGYAARLVQAGLSTLASNRDEIYIIDKKGKQDISDKQFNMISNEAKKYCEISEKDLIGHRNLYPSTAFIMQLAAEALQSNSDLKNNAISLLKEFVNTKYGDAVIVTVLAMFVTSSKNDGELLVMKEGAEIGDAAVNMHCTATYYTLARTEEDFGW